MCLPYHRDLDTWFEAVYALPIAWLDVTDIGAHYYKRLLPISFRTFAASWVYRKCGGTSHPSGVLRHHGITAPIS